MPDTTINARTDAQTDAGAAASSTGRSLWHRVGWFVLLWGASLGAWLLIAYGLRSLLAVD